MLPTFTLPQFPTAMDATRAWDGRQVMFKKIPAGIELEIGQYLSSPGLLHDSHNHCVPLLEILELPEAPEQKLIVMPFLRPFDNPRFQTFGEFVSFFTQICDVRLEHHQTGSIGTSDNPSSRVSCSCTNEILRTGALECYCQRTTSTNPPLRDCTANNIMLDPSGMYPKGFHPVQIDRSRDFRGTAKRFTRTWRPTRYYLIDFGLSRRYSSRNALDEPLRGGDKTAPEHRLGRLCNPFYTDIYYLGNLIRQRFLRVHGTLLLVHHVAYGILQAYNGFEFMAGLVGEMTNENPVERPTIEDVISRFSRIRKSLGEFKLRSPIMSKKDPGLITTYRCARQVVRTVGYIVWRKAAIPYA